MPKAAGGANPAATAAPGPARRGYLLDEATTLGDEREVINGLWTGDASTGKTSDVMAMANLGRTIVINAEGGIKKRPLQRLGVNTDNLQILPKDPAELSYDYLDQLFAELKTSCEQRPGEIIGCIWDSITEIHTKILQNVMDYQLSRAEAKGQSRISDAAPGDMINQFFTDLSDYGVMTGQMRLLLRKYRDLPIHFAITALQRRDKDDDGKVVYRPAITPALAKDLVGYVDVVCVTSVAEMPDGGDDEYRGLFRPVGKFRGKDRFGALPKYLIDPSFDRVVQYINDEIDVDTDPVMQAAKKRRAAAGTAKGKAVIADAEGADDPESEPEEEQGTDD